MMSFDGVCPRYHHDLLAHPELKQSWDLMQHIIDVAPRHLPECFCGQNAQVIEYYLCQCLVDPVSDSLVSVGRQLVFIHEDSHRLQGKDLLCREWLAFQSPYHSFGFDIHNAIQLRRP